MKTDLAPCDSRADWIIDWFGLRIKTFPKVEALFSLEIALNIPEKGFKIPETITD